MAEMITVKAAGGQREDGGWPTGLWERHPDHPATDAYPDGGETYVAGPDPVQVARTREVDLALREGRIVRVDEDTSSSGSGKGKKGSSDANTPSTGASDPKGTPLVTTS